MGAASAWDSRRSNLRVARGWEGVSKDGKVSLNTSYSYILPLVSAGDKLGARQSSGLTYCSHAVPREERMRLAGGS